MFRHKPKLHSHAAFVYLYAPKPYPDDISEERFYTNSDEHGAVLSHVCVERSQEELLKQIFDECEHSPYFDKLSAVESGLWPIILIACRHYRLPVPPHLWRMFRQVQVAPQM